MSTDGHLSTQPHQEGTSDPIMMNLNETLRSVQHSIEGLARQFQTVARDIQELKKVKTSTCKSWPKKEDTPKLAFKDHSKPKVKEKGRLIINPTRFFKCNIVGHNAINSPTKRTLVFIEDLNGWIEKSDEDCQECIVDKEETIGFGFIFGRNIFPHTVRISYMLLAMGDENRMSQSPMEIKLGPITRAQRRKLKTLEDIGIVAYMEEALKSKLEWFEGQERSSKLFFMCSISKEQSREQIGGEHG
ncbi:hypothetical protein M9H77_30998 [Catharanthus roseus]|uniref:Uncharacterized protein n=1 Tax=Catharanthus roseus TaxID=4058 RepID=A0ACB9ZZT1_CATRO|nr:hypothetical protein M9H77_30998 [Catharanthus roseus]